MRLAAAGGHPPTLAGEPKVRDHARSAPSCRRRLVMQPEVVSAVQLAPTATSEPLLVADSLPPRIAAERVTPCGSSKGLDFSRADAVRSLLTRALDQIEESSSPTKRGGR